MGKDNYKVIGFNRFGETRYKYVFADSKSEAIEIFLGLFPSYNQQTVAYLQRKVK